MNEKHFNASPRGAIPPGKLGLVVLAAALVPIFIRKCKPFVRDLADGMVKAGEKLRETVADPADGSAPSQPAAESHKTAEPKTTVKPKRTARSDRQAARNHPQSPLLSREVGAHSGGRV